MLLWPSRCLDPRLLRFLGMMNLMVVIKRWFVKLSDKIESLIKPVIAALGYVLWGLELHQSGRHTILRIYIDLPPGDERKSVGLDDCGEVSSQISAVLDVENPIAGAYNLEVSSCGLERSLFNIEQYQRYLGEMICIKLQQAQNGKRKFIGTLHTATADKIELIVDGEPVAFDPANISKANLSIKF